MFSLILGTYTAQMAGLFTEVFNWLPLAHCINSKILVSCVWSLTKIIVYHNSCTIGFFEWLYFINVGKYEQKCLVLSMCVKLLEN